MCIRSLCGSMARSSGFREDLGEPVVNRRRHANKYRYVMRNINGDNSRECNEASGSEILFEMPNTLLRNITK